MTRGYDQMRRITAPYIDRPVLALPLPRRLQRMIFEVHSRLNSRGPDIPVRWEDVAGVPTRIATPPGARGHLLWLHGGGFAIGSPRTHAALTDALAVATGLEVWSPAYRLAPEHPFPAAPDDCLAVARAMPGAMHIGGDSAGGNLALVTLQALLAEGRPPRSVVLVSPVVDMRPDRTPDPDVREMLLSRNFMRRCSRDYLAGQDDRDPRASPLLGRYEGCPPVHLELSAREILERDGLAIADHLRRAGARVTLHSEPRVPHVFHICAGRSDAADRAVARLAKVLR